MKTRGEIIADVAKRFIGVGTSHDTDEYLMVMAGPGDQTARMKMYFLAGPSTCALFARGVWRLCGVDNPILLDTYKIGQAVSDIQAISSHYGAWQRYNVDALPPKQGDVWIIDSTHNSNPHVGICVSEPVQGEYDTWTVDTVEGGQVPNSSYVRAFTRTFYLKSDQQTYLGERHLIGWAKASLMPIPEVFTEEEITAKILSRTLEAAKASRYVLVGDLAKEPEEAEDPEKLGGGIVIDLSRNPDSDPPPPDDAA